MKNLAAVFLILIGVNLSAMSQTTEETVKFKTSAVCEMCKKRIENDLSLSRGVKSAVLDLSDKTVTVVFDNERTNPEKLKKTISKIGYSADEVAAKPKAFNRLPECCQKSGCQM